MIDSPNPPGAATPGDGPWARLVVWSCWGLMVALTLSYVARFGCETPYFDEWEYVEIFAGEAPVTPQWLWAFHNEHRIVLQKLLLVTVYRLTGTQFLATTYLSVILLGALAGALIRAAGKLRGGTSYADAFFPLLLLHWAHYHTFWSGFQLQFVLSTGLAVVLLLVIARNPSRPGLGATALAGASLVALPLCGAQGLALVPPLALWLGGSSLLRLIGRLGAGGDEGARGRLAAILGMVLSVAGCVAVLLYLRGYRKPPYHPDCPGVLDAARTTAEFLASVLGVTTRSLWPGTGMAVVGLVLLAAVGLALTLWRRPAERGRAFGMLMFFAAASCLALAVGLGRSGFGPGAGAESRYAIIATPMLCWAYLVWVLYGPATAGRAAQYGMAAMLVAVLPPNMSAAVEHGQANKDRFSAFERDIRGGVPAGELARRYADSCLPMPFERSVRRMATLSKARIGAFKRLRFDPADFITSIELAVVGVNEMAWEGEVGRAVGTVPYSTVDLRGRRALDAIELTCTVDGPEADAALKFYWADSTRGTFGEDRTLVVGRLPVGVETTIRIPLGGEVVDYLRIDLAGGAEQIRVSGLSLVPPTDRAINYVVAKDRGEGVLR